MIVALDAMGGDNAPRDIVHGAVLASKQLNGKIMLVGDEVQINNYLSTLEYDKTKINVIHTTEVITNEDKPTTAIKKKKDSSLVKCFDLLLDNQADAMVSAGSTGALLVGAVHFLKRIKGISRPALAPFVPNAKNGFLIVDGGANTNTKPDNLLQFAVMGSVYANKVLKRDNPKIGLLNIGTEEAKGNELAKSTFSLLSESNLNFVGNVEARDTLSGMIDVVVCDGFAGNVLLKAIEGTAITLFSDVKEMFLKNTSSKLAAFMLKSGIKDLKHKYDYREYGGAPFLGVGSPVIKAHGTSDAMSIASAVIQANEFAESHALDELEEQIGLL